MGKSINLLSTILFAINVPAMRNKSETSFSSAGVFDLMSSGVGNRVPSD